VGVKHTLTLEIAGTKFRLVTTETDEQHLSELAAVVNERVAKLSGAGKAASPAQLLAMVALGLADDLANSEKKLREVDRLTRTTIANLMARIDSRLSHALEHADDPDETVEQQPE
jgi:cell division protein ZapA (FtsZ GTPase activity inhibitor)